MDQDMDRKPPRRTAACGMLALIWGAAPAFAGTCVSASTAFRFSLGTLNFSGKGPGALALEDGRAGYEGSGALNGKDGYRFALAR